MLDHVLSFKREAKKINIKVAENILYMIAHSASGFDSYVYLIKTIYLNGEVSLI